MSRTIEKPAAATRRVLIVEDQTLAGLGIRNQLEKLGHTVVGQAANAAEALQLFRDAEPDLILMDIRLDRDDGIELTGRLMAERRCPVIIVSAYGEDELTKRAGAAGVFGYLLKPVGLESLRAQISVAIQRYEEQENLINKNAELTTALESRKIIERAKGVFMKRLNMTEAEAYRKLQLESQNRRISMAELAKKILESEELLGGS